MQEKSRISSYLWLNDDGLPNLDTESMVDHLSFFKPRRPKLCQIGQTRYQSTPLYLYIQNIKSVCIVQWYMTFRLHCADIIFKVRLHCICLKY